MAIKLMCMFLLWFVVDQAKAFSQLEEKQKKESYEFEVNYIKRHFVLQLDNMLKRNDEV